jgi:hypothetical protein
MGETNRKASKVYTYLTLVRSKIEPGAYLSEEPLSRKARGSSRPPVSESVLTLMELNSRAASVLDPLIEELAATNTEIGGHRCDGMLSELASHPGCERSWSEQKRGALWGMCVLLASATDTDFEVYASVSGIAGVGEGNPATKREARKLDTRDSYRLIVAEIERIERETGMGREEVKRHLRDTRDWSIGKQNDALGFVKRERGDGEVA